MRFIVIGLGSMGTRRIRVLKTLGYDDIVGFDTNVIPEKEYGIPVIQANDIPNPYYALRRTIEESEKGTIQLKGKYDAMIVSVPPLLKQPYINIAADLNIPCFCEADVITYSGTYCSSATMRFYPAIVKIKELLDAGTLGKVYTFTYHCGNSLYDWHPDADMKTYYAAKKESGACKEMFAFELGWLSMLFGRPIEAKGIIDKKLDDPDIKADDIFATTVKFAKQSKDGNIRIGTVNFGKGTSLFPLVQCDTITGTILIDILSRPAIRELRIVGEKCNLFWNWDYNCMELEYPNGEITMIFYQKTAAFEGYNKNISEQMYIDELANYINSIQGKETYIYSSEEEKQVIKMLEMLENSEKREYNITVG
ncbi:MAG: hypothetical protein PHQ35_09395 [Phycisphaerae bacterium]|nr:hypothetical protein [Phycisphaerae bacterium]MDD5239931.1 hypothetical protein [Candidatus Nanoarchaeia archaeon]